MRAKHLSVVRVPLQGFAGWLSACEMQNAEVKSTRSVVEESLELIVLLYRVDIAYHNTFFYIDNQPEKPCSEYSKACYCAKMVMNL